MKQSVNKHRYSNFTKIIEVNLSAFAYRLFHEDFSSILGAEWIEGLKREIFMKQPVNNYR